MKISKKLFFILPAALALVSATIIVQSDKEEAIDQILMQSLNTVHYSPQTIDNNFSEKVYKLYLQRLDYNKKFLIQSDVEELKKFEKLVDDDINNARFEFFDKSFEIINKRVEEAKTYYTEILSKPFDFSGDETIQLMLKKSITPKTKRL